MKTLMIAATSLLLAVHAHAADKTDFSGFYVGGTALFGSSTRIQGGEDGWLRHRIPDIEDFRPKPAQLGGFGGYNIVDGKMMYGFELDFRSDLARARRNSTNPIYEKHYPQAYVWGSGGGGPAGGGSLYYMFDGGISKQDYKERYEYQETFAPTASFRIGRQIDNVLLYARLGAGGSLISEKFTSDDTSSTYCTNETSRYDWTPTGQFTGYITGCLNPYAGKKDTKSKSTFLPTATFAIGAEYHFDSVFTRLEGELRHTFLNENLMFSPSDGATRYAISASIGYRF